MEKDTFINTYESRNGIKAHFDSEADEFDGIIKNLIPYYFQMVGAIINSIPFDKDTPISVIDLGCGTGTIAKSIKDVFPNAKITCVDISENMLKIAKRKIGEGTYICSDFYNFDFKKNYDVIASSLALHHLATISDKLDFYQKIFDALKPGGIFVNADIVLASTENLQARNMMKWKDFMIKSVAVEQVENKWIPTYYEEDRPISIHEHFSLLEKAGFSDLDVVWKYYNFAVYMAVKK